MVCINTNTCIYMHMYYIWRETKTERQRDGETEWTSTPTINNAHLRVWIRGRVWGVGLSLLILYSPVLFDFDAKAYIDFIIH